MNYVAFPCPRALTARVSDQRSAARRIRSATRSLPPTATCNVPLRAGNWKLIVYPKINKIQLFDLDKDPDEIHDLSVEPAQAGRIKELTARLRKQQEHYGDVLSLTSTTPDKAEVDLSFFMAATKKK